MPEASTRQVSIVGAGLGGISAALSLALEGYRVTILEKNDKIGGKLNWLSADGYQFDLGPSILTLPHIFERTFQKAGKRMEDYVPMCTVRPHWRNIFEDGAVIDLYPEPQRMAEEAARAGESPAAVEQFLAYSGALYDLINRGYFEHGLDSVSDFQSFYGLMEFMKFDLLRNMHQGVARRLRTPHFRDIFDFFIKYVGSSAYRAPAFLNCMATIQFRYDLWYVPGGMYGLARGLERLIRELGIEIRLNSEVQEIQRSPDGRRVTGLRLVGGDVLPCETVVSNLEVIPTHRRLLKTSENELARMQRKLEPACSGLVIDLGLDCKYENLAHHNFFFSRNQREHFHTVFQDHLLPEDPTLYVVVASRTDPTVSPAGCDCLKILPHIPYLRPDRPVTHEMYVALKDRVLQKMERMGCTDLRRHIVFEHFWTPHDIERNYYSNGGSIYGVVSDRFKNLAFKAARKSDHCEGLYFVGGSVNPGGGMPMVFQCGQNVARLIVERDHGR